jgi:hypothetical protein
VTEPLTDAVDHRRGGPSESAAFSDLEDELSGTLQTLSLP